jgi:hypothetical protein
LGDGGVYMSMAHLRRLSSGWGSDALVPVGTGGGATTSSRPTILFDQGPNASAQGQYYIYNNPGWNTDGLTVPEVHQLITETGFWIDKRMINEWTITRSDATAALYGGDVAWGWRMAETFTGSPNRFQVFLTSSGISDSGLTDFDDVTWIQDHGLHDSLVQSHSEGLALTSTLTFGVGTNPANPCPTLRGAAHAPGEAPPPH